MEWPDIPRVPRPWQGPVNGATEPTLVRRYVENLLAIRQAARHGIKSASGQEFGEREFVFDACSERLCDLVRRAYESGCMELKKAIVEMIRAEKSERVFAMMLDRGNGKCPGSDGPGSDSPHAAKFLE
jgi:hypothetical protein